MYYGLQPEIVLFYLILMMTFTPGNMNTPNKILISTVKFLKKIPKNDFLSIP